MGVRILHDRDQNYAALYCSTTARVFGPLFDDANEGDHDAQERAEAFLRFLPQDARKYTDLELQDQFCAWLEQEPTQWQAEQDVEDAKSADDDEIEELKAQAEADHDDDTAVLCEQALQGDVTARAKCSRRILDQHIARLKTFHDEKVGG